MSWSISCTSKLLGVSGTCVLKCAVLSLIHRLFCHWQADAKMIRYFDLFWFSLFSMPNRNFTMAFLFLEWSFTVCFCGQLLSAFHHMSPMALKSRYRAFIQFPILNLKPFSIFSFSCARLLVASWSLYEFNLSSIALGFESVLWALLMWEAPTSAGEKPSEVTRVFLIFTSVASQVLLGVSCASA